MKLRLHCNCIYPTAQIIVLQSFILFWKEGLGIFFLSPIYKKLVIYAANMLGSILGKEEKNIKLEKCISNPIKTHQYANSSFITTFILFIFIWSIFDPFFFGFGK